MVKYLQEALNSKRDTFKATANVIGTMNLGFVGQVIE